MVRRQWWNTVVESTITAVVFTPEQPRHTEQHQSETEQPSLASKRIAALTTRTIPSTGRKNTMAAPRSPDISNPPAHTAMRAAMDNSTRFHGFRDSRRRMIRAVSRSPRSIIWETAVLAARGTYPSLDSLQYTAIARRS